MRTDNPRRFLLQNALVAVHKDGKAPNHLDTFTSAQREYRLADGADSIAVPLVWQSGDGITVTKTYTFQTRTIRIQSNPAG